MPGALELHITTHMQHSISFNLSSRKLHVRRDSQKIRPDMHRTNSLGDTSEI